MIIAIAILLMVDVLFLNPLLTLCFCLPFCLGCTFRINGDLGQPQPVYLHSGTYLRPNGNTGQIRLNTGQQVIIGCPGRTISHPNIASTAVVAVRIKNNRWLKPSILFC